MRYHYLFRLPFVICLSLISPYLVSTEIKLALTHIPQVMEYNKPNAPYTRLINTIREQSKLEFESIYLPSSRANKLLNEQKLDCIFPILPTDNRDIPTAFSVPVNGIRAHIFSVKDKPYLGLDELTGLSVVYLRGYLFGDLIKHNTQINFFPVNSQAAAFSMLKKNRANAYLDYIPDIKYALNKKQIAELSFSEDNPVLSSFDRLECFDDEKTQAFLKVFDQQIMLLRKTGELKNILGKYYVKTTD